MTITRRFGLTAKHIVAAQSRLRLHAIRVSGWFLSALLALAALAAHAQALTDPARTASSCAAARVNYTPADKARLEKVRVSSAASDARRSAPAASAGALSPQGTASMSIEKPDYTSPGPWTTRVRVVGNGARPIDLAIDFIEHAQYDVKATWFNEKLIAFKVFWGRVVGTDIVFDIERGRVLYAEDADYSGLLNGCSRP